MEFHKIQQKKIAKNCKKMHRTGIEPVSAAWKATIIPLDQRCL